MSEPKELDMSAIEFVKLRDRDREAARKARASREMLIKLMLGMKFALVGIFLLVLFILAGTVTNCRDQQGKVISRQRNGFVIETLDGNLWEVEGNANSNNVYVVFNTKGTNSLADDEIIFIKSL